MHVLPTGCLHFQPMYLTKMYGKIVCEYHINKPKILHLEVSVSVLLHIDFLCQAYSYKNKTSYMYSLLADLEAYKIKKQISIQCILNVNSYAFTRTFLRILYKTT